MKISTWFFVEFQGKRSRWRNQRNGLPQGSVLAPSLFNIYTNDQPSLDNTKRFLYADDLALTTQGDNFEEVEECLTTSLREFSNYYRLNHLKPNPSKTQVCAFHLRNREARRQLEISWEGAPLEHSFTPKYLGVTLDRSLTYKKHCDNIKLKVAARNNIVRKLAGSTWGAHPRTLRTTALSLCFSAAEYACPVWYHSVHAKRVDLALHESCRIVTGCLKPTPINKLQLLSGIAPPHVRREVAARQEKTKAMLDEKHPLHGHIPPQRRLKSRKSFLPSTATLENSPETTKVELWNSQTQHPAEWFEAKEQLPPGHECGWKTWKALNRLRAGVGRCKENLQKWKYLDDNEAILCLCGEIQTMSHLIECPLAPTTCTQEDLIYGTSGALQIARYWADTV